MPSVEFDIFENGRILFDEAHGLTLESRHFGMCCQSHAVQTLNTKSTFGQQNELELVAEVWRVSGIVAGEGDLLGDGVGGRVSEEEEAGLLINRYKMSGSIFYIHLLCLLVPEVCANEFYDPIILDAPIKQLQCVIVTLLRIHNPQIIRKFAEIAKVNLDGRDSILHMPSGLVHLNIKSRMTVNIFKFLLALGKINELNEFDEF